MNEFSLPYRMGAGLLCIGSRDDTILLLLQLTDMYWLPVISLKYGNHVFSGSLGLTRIVYVERCLLDNCWPIAAIVIRWANKIVGQQSYSESRQLNDPHFA
jgi:hypothetical protein